MLVDLPTCAGWLTAVAAARARRRAGPGALSALAQGWAEAAVERERRATLAVVIAGLPAGWCLTERDACGRERFVGPAGVESASVGGAQR